MQQLCSKKKSQTVKWNKSNTISPLESMEMSEICYKKNQNIFAVTQTGCLVQYSTSFLLFQ